MPGWIADKPLIIQPKSFSKAFEAGNPGSREMNTGGTKWHENQNLSDVSNIPEHKNNRRPASHLVALACDPAVILADVMAFS